MTQYRAPMPTYADQDAEQVAHGIRLGGRGHLLDQALAAGEPLTVQHLERIARPDLQQSSEGPGIDHETLGMLHLYKVSETYTLACEWFGWLPGHYTTRQAALVAYGYILGGENAGYLDKLAVPRLEGYTLAEIEAFAAGDRSGPNSRA